MQKILLICLVLAILLEGTLTSLPLVIMLLLIIGTQMRSNDVFFVGFFSGLLLDVLLVRPLGETSVYFLVVLFLLFLYDRKYEVSSPLFVTLVTFIASSIYVLIFPVPGSFFQIVVVTLMAFLGYSALQMITKKRTKPVRL